MHKYRTHSTVVHIMYAMYCRLYTHIYTQSCILYLAHGNSVLSIICFCFSYFHLYNHVRLRPSYCMLTAESASEGLHAILIINYICLGILYHIYILIWGSELCAIMHYMQLNALTAQPLNRCRRYWLLLLIV